MNKRGYTLIELVISITIFIGMLLIFFFIIKNTILFVNLHKQEMVMLSNVNLIKSKVNESFDHGKIRILPVSELSATWVYSLKDNVVENGKLHTIDTIALEYEDIISYSSGSHTETWVLVLGAVNDQGKIIAPPSSEYGFFSVRHLAATGELLSYTVHSTGAYIPALGDYTNTNVKIREFRYSLVNNAAYLRIDMSYDNDIDGAYEKIGSIDEYYFSGSTYWLKKLDPK